jgi:hypothetical protein
VSEEQNGAPVEAGEPDTQVESAELAETAETAESAGSVKKPLRKGRIAAVAGSVLVVGALVAGVGVTGVIVRDADRDAGAPVWKLSAGKGKGEGEDGKAAQASGLAGSLVPYGTEGWERGPDLGEFGADVSLSGVQASALQKESFRDLPRSQRRQMEKRLDKLRVKGMAMRSYVGARGRAVTVSIVLSQMESRAAVRDMATSVGAFLKAVDLFRKGPAIKGHDNAECFLPPKDAETDLDSMFCSAYVGEVLVTATADAVKPFDTKGVAMLLRTQLDRIAEPGKAV